MQHKNIWMVLVLVFAGIQLSACQKTAAERPTEHPVTVELIEGSELSRVILAEKAMERLAVRTDKVGEVRSQKTVPYSALIYDTHGKTWVYTSPQERMFVRHQVTVDRIEGDLVYLSEGPRSGTVVASVAVAEIYGAEFEIGH